TSIKASTLNIDLNAEIKENWANEIAFCTSGTTGDSRVFVYDGERIFNQIYAAYNMPKITADIMYLGNIRLLGLLPFSHIFGFVAVFLWYTFFGFTIVFPNSHSSDEILKTITKYKCTHIYGVPMLFDSITNKFKSYIKLQSENNQELTQKFIKFNNKYITATEAGFARTKFVKKQIQNKIFGTQIVYCISGGGPLSKTTLETLNGIGYNLYNGYGMTEVGITSVELSSDVSQRLRGSVGQALYGVAYKIINNELCVKSQFTHKYRLENGKSLSPLLDKEGYFHTGDVAEIDNMGYVFIKGKIKDVIIGSNGENIYPDEIETKFKTLPFVKNVGVLGINKTGNEVLALVLYAGDLNEEEIKILENSIKDHNDDLPSSIQVKECYLSKEPLPVSFSEKIKKYIIKEDIEKDSEKYIKLGNGISVTFNDFDSTLIKETMDKVINVIASILYLEPSKIAPHSHIITDLGGDSFSYMSVIYGIENEFKITIPSEKIGRLNSASEFTLFILKNKN
ncbi:MAG: AMP-binding protein, partial [Bacilli bacterium]|nr:AMP-binding protein [Bacilli bacterium]